MTATISPVDTALSELRDRLPGRVSAPGDADWDEAHLAWARSVDQRPVAVVHVQHAEDVVTAVRCASAAGLSVAAQPVGHGATPAITGTVLLRTRGLQEISVDPQRRIARVGAGVKWGELLAVTAEYGLTGLAGSSPDPSVTGFSVSGGLSWFGRAHGLAAHSIRAVDLVDAGGELRRVTADSDPDVFWAVCGGGGDFGIVTAIEVALYPAPQVYGGRLLWPLEMAWPVLRAFRDIAATAPDELTMWAHLLRFPPLPEVPEFLRGGAFVSVDAAFLGSESDAEALLAPLREIPAMCLDTMATLPVSALGSICAEPVDPMPAIESAGLLSDFDDTAIGRLLDVAGHRVDSPLVIVQVRHLGGALARGSQAQGPSGAVTEPFQLFCLGVPVVPELGPAIEASIAAVKVALDDYLTGRTFFTFLGDDDDPTAAFAPEALARLQDIKRVVDPTGVIRSNRPVLR
jgi:FAD/FMN-containing dehydrogenase